MDKLSLLSNELQIDLYIHDHIQTKILFIIFNEVLLKAWITTLQTFNYKTLLFITLITVNYALFVNHIISLATWKHNTLKIHDNVIVFLPVKSNKVYFWTGRYVHVSFIISIWQTDIHWYTVKIIPLTFSYDVRNIRN